MRLKKFEIQIIKKQSILLNPMLKLFDILRFTCLPAVRQETKCA